MARALWKGLVNFGLVNIPIELHTGSRDHTPRFRLLHRTDLSPIKMERVCQTDGHAVGWDDLVKGYEIEPGHFVAKLLLKLGERETLLRGGVFVPGGRHGGRRFEDRGDLVVVIATLG